MLGMNDEKKDKSLNPKTSKNDMPKKEITGLTAEEEKEILERRLELAEMEATDKNIALIEMTASRNALYKSLQETQIRLAEILGQRENDIEAYKKELELRLSEKRELQEKCDTFAIKARRYDELQESLVKIKMNAEIHAHSIIDEAQEKAMDTIMLIDDIKKEINLFREDIEYLRRDIKIGTITLDDRLENIYLRLCRNLDRLIKIEENFYIKNSLPISDTENISPNGSGAAPNIIYPENLNKINDDSENNSENE